MATLSDFRTRFPEFKLSPDAYVQVFLDSSTLEVDTDAWGALSDVATLYMAAHRLAMTPFGQSARMVNKDGTTTYGMVLEELRATTIVGATTL